MLIFMKAIVQQSPLLKSEGGHLSATSLAHTHTDVSMYARRAFVASEASYDGGSTQTHSTRRSSNKRDTFMVLVLCFEVELNLGVLRVVL